MASWPSLGGTGVSKSQVSRLCEDIDERVQAFLHRPIEGQWPYLWIDATGTVRNFVRWAWVDHVIVAQATGKRSSNRIAN